MTSAKHLVLSPQGADCDDPHQRKFKRLLLQIDKARQALEEWDAAVPLFVQGHAELVQPQLREVSGLRLAFIEQLHRLLVTEKGWARADAEFMGDMLCGNAMDLIGRETLSPEQRERCRALHDEHALQSIEEIELEAADEMKAVAQAMTGIDLGDEPGTPEELFQRLQQRLLEAQAQAQSEAAPPRPRKLSKAAAARAEREQAEAQAAQQSVREVFRKLAAALHPDRATDDADRLVRTGRMQRANQAYARDDLLALLSLQLEIEQIDAEHAARVTSQRARQFNLLLSEQLQELKQALELRQAVFGEGYALPPHERPSAKMLGTLLQRLKLDAEVDSRDLRSDLRQLAGGKPAVRAWLKQARRQVEAEDPFLALLGGRF